MEISSIKKHYTIENNRFHDVINETLNSGSYNESWYYKYTLMVTIKPEKADFLSMLYYKAFWESIGDHKEIYPAEKNTYTFLMSLMTAIDFIYEATPPLLQSKIKESITSIDNIVEILKTYLLEDNPDRELRIGIFFKKNGMYDYGGIWNDSNDKTKKIRSIVDKDNYQPTIAYVDIDDGKSIRQYIISAPISQIPRIYVITKELYITHVFVVKATSLIQKDIVNIKGYVTNYHAQEYSLKTLDTECFNTLKMLE
jgi:hypothetical protein